MFQDQNALLAISIATSIVLMDRLKHRFLAFAICALPGTFFHELSHFLVAAVTGGRPSSFSVIPRRVEGGYVLGQVGFRNPRAYNILPIGLSPLLLLPLAYWLYRWIAFNHASLPAWLIGLCLFATGSLIHGALPSGADLRLVWRYGRVPLALFAALGFGFMLWFWPVLAPAKKVVAKTIGMEIEGRAAKPPRASASQHAPNLPDQKRTAAAK